MQYKLVTRPLPGHCGFHAVYHCLDENDVGAWLGAIKKSNAPVSIKLYKEREDGNFVCIADSTKKDIEVPRTEDICNK